MSGTVAEPETSAECALEVRIRWQSTVLAARSLARRGQVILGDHPESLARLPTASLGAAWVLLARRSRSGAESYEVRIPAGATAELQRAAATKVVCGPADLATESGDRIEIGLGDFRVELRHEAAAARLPRTPVSERINRGALRHVAAAALLHAAFFAVFAYHRPALAGQDDASLREETLGVLRQYLVSAAVRERDATAGEPSDGATSDAASSGGARAAESEGSTGNSASSPGDRRVKRGLLEPTSLDPLDRAGQMLAARSFGLIGLLATASSSAPAADWRIAQPSGSAGAFGDMWTADIGEAAGSGLGRLGLGLGGGGSGRGIGLDPGDLFGVGRAFGDSGDGDGIGGGRACAGCGLGSHAVATPRWRVGQVEVNGRIPGEVIQRVVRNNMGRFRGCYEAGLRENPALAGRVVTRFAIDRQGLVASAQDGGSALADPRVVSCVVKAFYSLSFPEHEGGIVTVVYPLSLEPS